MKLARLITISLVLVVALSLAFAVAPAYAEDFSSRNVTNGQDYTLQAVRESGSGKIVGVSYRGYYFSASGIEVSAQFYSDESTVIDFDINADESTLTPAQQSTRAKILQLASNIHKYICSIDNAVNTQYDGKDGLSTSYVYQYNNAAFGQTVEVDGDTYKMLQIARVMYDATNGAFNPAVYRLVDLWGFSSRTYYKNGNLPYDRQWTDNSYPLPDDKYIQAFSSPAFTDFSQSAVQLSTQDGKYYVTKNVRAAVVDGVEYNQWLDLGGIAKGYVVDGINEMIRNLGLTRFYVDAGTSSQAYGKGYDGDDFVLSTRDPYKTDFLFQPTVAEVKLFDGAIVSSSGQYERKFTTNGVEYAHIIDGTLGKPAQTGVNSITIIAPQGYSATMGDCLTTALTVMGRDRTVEFMNGYLKDNGIKVLLTYETVDGGKQLLSNYDKAEVAKGDTFDDYAWSIGVDGQGNFFYDASAKAPVSLRNYTGWIIALGVIVILAVVAVIVVHLVKGRAKTAQNVLNAKRDKPFKAGDVGAYLAVALLIVVLFAVFFANDSGQLRTIKMVDFTDSSEGELLFVYNVARNEWATYSDNTGGWNVEVTEDGNDINVRFTREVNGKEQCNVMTITRGATTSVKMIEANCDDKSCVYNFPSLTDAERAIVCSPNRLKIITQ